MGASESVVVVTVFFFLISFTSLSLSSSIPIKRWCLSDTLTKKDPEVFTCQCLDLLVCQTGSEMKISMSDLMLRPLAIRAKAIIYLF